MFILTVEKRTMRISEIEMPDTIDGKPTRNSLGQLIHPTVEGIRNFWNWFGDSKVVDSQGRPLVVYHGTPAKSIEQFSGGETAYGIFFAPDYHTASYYANDKSPNIYSVYLKVSELADFDETDVFEKVMREAVDYTVTRSDEDSRRFAEVLYKQGYGKNAAVTEFFDSIDGISEVNEDYTIYDLLYDERIGSSEIEDLVDEIGTQKVKDRFDEYAPPYSEELDAAREAYGTQNFYMYFQDDFMRAAKGIGYDGVIFSDPSSTGESISIVVFDANQIKSATNNNGNFSRNSKNITEIDSNDYSPDSDAEDYSTDYPSITKIKQHIHKILQVSQKEYDDWNEDDIDTYAGGGICHLIADSICSVLFDLDVECSSVSSCHEQHVYVAVKCKEGLFTIDIPYWIYETGGGFNWKKIPDVKFEERDIQFYRVSSDPEEFDAYTENW